MEQGVLTLYFFLLLARFVYIPCYFFFIASHTLFDAVAIKHNVPTDIVPLSLDFEIARSER